MSSKDTFIDTYYVKSLKLTEDPGAAASGAESIGPSPRQYSCITCNGTRRWAPPIPIFHFLSETSHCTLVALNSGLHM